MQRLAFQLSDGKAALMPVLGVPVALLRFAEAPISPSSEPLTLKATRTGAVV